MLMLYTVVAKNVAGLARVSKHVTLPTLHKTACSALNVKLRRQRRSRAWIFSLNRCSMAP